MSEEYKFRILEPTSIEYWHEYHLRLINFIEYYKKSLDDQPTEENINFNYNVEFYSEKLARLYAEANRVKTILSVLKYTYETGEI